MIKSVVVTELEKPIFPPFDSHPRLVLGVIVALFLVGLVTRWMHHAGVIAN